MRVGAGKGWRVPIMARTAEVDRVQELQRTLYRAAKADPGRRFHALWDKVWRRDVLQRAWSQVRANQGAPGIDRTTIADVESYGASRMLDELATDLREERWRPLPARRVWIPKPGSVEQRPLSIPTVRDRVAQAALRIVLEPIFEADFVACSFGFRPKRGAHDALQVLIDESWRDKRWVVETDIASCFEAIPHDRLMAVIEERICDRHVLKALRALLRAGVLEDDGVRRRDTGTPQGGVISPLLCNVYLNQLDRVWPRRCRAVLVRYADDIVVMCVSSTQAAFALMVLRDLLAEIGLAPKEDKTRIVHLEAGGEGFDFLGFHHQLVTNRGPRHQGLEFLARRPSRRATQRARDRIRQITDRSRLRVEVEDVVGNINQFLRGWSGYFRYGNSAESFDKITSYAKLRLALFVAKRHQRSRSYGFAMLYRSPNQLGLIDLNGSVVAPRPNQAWRAKPNATR
jgi:group II intron reverse transcriptase/maturase